MKKFLLTLAAGALMGGSANAVYLIGSPAGEWSPTNGIKMEKVDDRDDSWTWTGNIGENDYFAFATELMDVVDWNTFNSLYRLSPTEPNTEISTGQFELVSDKDASFKGRGVNTQLTVTLENEKYILDVKLLDEPTPPVETGWGLIGSMTGWQDDLEMTKGENGLWTLSMPFISGEFKFRANKNWKDNLGSVNQTTEIIKEDGEFTLTDNNGSNFCIIDGTNVVFTLDPENKTLTITGEFGEDALALRTEFYDWSWSPAYKLREYDTKGVYVISFRYFPGGKGFKFGNFFNTTSYTTANEEMTADEAYDFVLSDDAMMLKQDMLNVLFSVDTNKKTLTISGTPIDKMNLSIIGEFSNWEEDIDMEELLPGYWRLSLESLDGEFKFRSNKGWDVSFGGDEKPTVINEQGAYYFSDNGGNFKINNATNVVLTADLINNFVWVMANLPVEPEPVLPEGPMYIIGQVDGGNWSPTTGVEMKKVNGGWQWKGHLSTSEYIAFATELLETEDWDNFNTNYRLSPETDGTELIEDNFPMHFGEPCGAFKGQGATYELIVKKDDNNNYSLLSQILSMDPDSPLVSWGVVGEFNDWKDDVVMTCDSAGVYSVKMAELAGEFKVRANKEWAMNFGAANETNVVLDEGLEIAQDGKNFVIEETQNVKVILNVKFNTLTVIKEDSSVELITEDSNNATYYNLQGLRVEKPADGIYIRVANGKTRKIVIK